MKTLSILLLFTLTATQSFSQLCLDSINYNLRDDNYDDRILHKNVRIVLSERFNLESNEESLVFYNRENEIFKFLFNENGIYKGFYILWLYEITVSPQKDDLSWGPLRNYCINLTEKELGKFKKQKFDQLLALADTNIFPRNVDTTFIDNMLIKFHKGEFGIIYKSKICKIEYFEKDKVLSEFNDTFKKQFKTNSKRKKILKSLDYNHYSFGGCEIN